MNVDRVLAINPQTLLEPGVECFAHGNLYRLKWCNSQEAHYRDLLNLPFSESNTMVDIIYGVDSRVGRFHSGRMEEQANVNLIKLPGEHGTVSIHMRDNGELEKALSLPTFRKK